jgi:uncharacterized protein DUF3857/transglutaminase superfamily protein
MRIQVFAGVVLTLAALAQPIAGMAQKFQEPTKEELQMTSDPKAPGADAVYLYREEITDNYNKFVSVRARIKVLTEKGKRWATFEVPYTPGYQAKPIVEGRTVHPDGSVYPLTISDADLLEIQNKVVASHRLVLSLPSVTVGSILEYRWTREMVGSDLYRLSGGVEEAAQKEFRASLAGSELAYEIPEWEVQQPLFVHKAHYLFSPFTKIETRGVMHPTFFNRYIDGQLSHYLICTTHLPGSQSVSESPDWLYSLDIADVPAISYEPNAPSGDSFIYRVRFYFSPYVSPDDYWAGETKRWSGELDRFAEQTKDIKDSASQIIAGADTPEAKARKLYDAVQALNNTDFSRAKDAAERKQLHLKSELKKAQDVWSEKSGSGNDIAALYLALARAAGLQADGLKVADRSQRIFDPNYLSLYQLDSLLVVLHIDGKDIYLDPGEELCPFGQLHWTHVMAGGLEENAKWPMYTPPNVMKDAVTAHAAELTLDAQGGMTGTVKILINGPAALHWRQLNLTTDGDEVKKQFDDSLHEVLPRGISGEVTGFQGMDTSAGYLSAVVTVSGQLGTTTGKRMMLPGFFFSTGQHSRFVAEEKRESAVDLHYAEQVIDDVVYHLPTGFSVESAPSAAQLPWPDHAALVVKTAPGAGTFDIKHIFARAFVLLDAKEYPALRDYYQKIATGDQQQLVLAQAASSAGN